MVRWEPGAQERLERAALDLFAERGYANVTVTEIAAAAGLTRASYFRYFADKREVLFAGQDALVTAIATALRAAPPASPAALVGRALDAVAPAFSPERQHRAVARQDVIDAEPELAERVIAKRAAIAAALTAGLRERGVADCAAAVAGHLGQLAFTAGSQAWAESGADFAPAARNFLDEAVRVAARLDQNRG